MGNQGVITTSELEYEMMTEEEREQLLVLGERIRKVRRSKKITQRALAKGLCSQSNISKVEHGEHAPSIFLIKRIAERLEVTFEYLCENE